MTERRLSRAFDRAFAPALAAALAAALFAAAAVAEIVDFSADTVKYKLGKPKEIVCSGRAVISNAENVIRADRIVIFGEQLDTAKCYRHVRIRSLLSGLELRSEYVEFDQKSDYIRLLQDPVLTMKDLRIASGAMERYNGPRLSVIQGETVITRSNMDIRCREGRYDEPREIVVLKGAPDVRFRKEPGEPLRNGFSCGEVVFFNTNDRLILNKDVKGKIYFDE
jgi:hypothetical protein